MPVNRKISCIAIDDEPPAIDVLKNHIAAIPSLELVGTSNNAVEALIMLQQQTIDLIFLDIQMPQLLGTDMLRILKRPPKVIFTTAYRKFAIEGFELDAVDYLLKPISFERFLKAVNKVMDTSFQTVSPMASEVFKTNSLEGYISLRADRKNLKIPVADILYIESLKDYIKVVTINRTIITKQPISSIEEMLPKDYFLRIHRSYIVALQKIETYTTELIGIGKQEFPISRMYRLEVGKALKTN